MFSRLVLRLSNGEYDGLGLGGSMAEGMNALANALRVELGALIWLDAEKWLW